jgi:hypothetical protein
MTKCSFMELATISIDSPAFSFKAANSASIVLDTNTW